MGWRQGTEKWAADPGGAFRKIRIARGPWRWPGTARRTFPPGSAKPPEESPCKICHVGNETGLPEITGQNWVTAQ